MAVGSAVDGDALHAELLEQLRHYHCAHRVHRVEHDLEVGVADGLQVYQLVVLDGVYVDLGVIFICNTPQFGDFPEIEVLGFGGGQYGLALGVGEELALVAEQLEGIPLHRIVAGGDDDAAVGLLADYGNLCGRSGRHADVDNLNTACHQSVADQAVYHGAGDAGVAAHNYLLASLGVCGSEFNYIDGGQGIAHCAADGSSDSGN